MQRLKHISKNRSRYLSLSSKTAKPKTCLKTFSCEYLKAKAHICRRGESVWGEYIKMKSQG